MPWVMDDRTTATKSGPGRMRAGMKTAKTLIRTTMLSMESELPCPRAGCKAHVEKRRQEQE